MSSSPSSLIPFELYQQALADYQAGQYQAAIRGLTAVWESCEPMVNQTSGVLPFTDLKQFLVSLGQVQAELTWQLDLHFSSGLLLAQIYIDNQNPNQAIPLLQSLTQSYAPRAQLHHYLANAYLLNGERHEALIQLSRAVEVDANYIPAYEDLAFLANQNQDYDLAVRILEQGLKRAVTPKLFEELLSCSAQSEFLDFRHVFIELCVRHIQVRTFPLLKKLCQNLYLQEDLAHTAYLAHRLLAFSPEDLDLKNLYLLASLRNKQYAEALQYLMAWLEAAPEDPELWYKLGIAYQQWNMSLFARHAFYKTSELTTEEPLYKLAEEAIYHLPNQVSLEDCLHQVLKMLGLSLTFRQLFKLDPQNTLEDYGIGWSESLAQALEKVSFFT